MPHDGRVPDPVTLTIARCDGTTLTLENAERVAHAFFALDRSSRGGESYDDRALDNPANVIEAADLSALNKTFRARSPSANWEDVIDTDPLPALAGLTTDWDLISTPDGEWQESHCEGRIGDALTALFGYGRQV